MFGKSANKIKEKLSDEIQELIEDAMLGDAVAQNQLGGKFYRGDGVPKDYEIAFKWLKKSALQGVAAAQFNVGYFYSKGLGTTKDLSEAIVWCRKAAEQGYPAAQQNLEKLLAKSELHLITEKEPKKPINIGRVNEQKRTVTFPDHFVAARSTSPSSPPTPPYQKQFKTEKKKTAIDIPALFKCANEGDPIAQFKLGCCIEKRRGIDEDISKAVPWYKKSALGGHALAQLKFGDCLKEGFGIGQDDAQAFYWHKKAALQNVAAAQYCLFEAFRSGKGVKQDEEEAVLWCRKAAILGFANAQFELARHYECQEAKKDNQGEVWFQKAAIRQLADAGFCNSGDLDLKQGYEAAASWLEKAARKGHVKAQLNLGFYCLAGKGRKKSSKEAIFWFRKAVLKGDTNAQACLGIYCYEKRNFKKAAKLFRHGARKGNVSAQFNLGICFANGEGVAQDYAEAADYFRKAAEQGNAVAQFYLGNCFENGKGVVEDRAQAIIWYEKALAQGYDPAQRSLERLNRTVQIKALEQSVEIKAQVSPELCKFNFIMKLQNGEGFGDPIVHIPWTKEKVVKEKSAVKVKTEQEEVGKGTEVKKDHALEPEEIDCEFKSTDTDNDAAVLSVLKAHVGALISAAMRECDVLSEDRLHQHIINDENLLIYFRMMAILLCGAQKACEGIFSGYEKNGRTYNIDYVAGILGRMGKVPVIGLAAEAISAAISVVTFPKKQFEVKDLAFFFVTAKMPEEFLRQFSRKLTFGRCEKIKALAVGSPQGLLEKLKKGVDVFHDWVKANGRSDPIAKQAFLDFKMIIHAILDKKLVGFPEHESMLAVVLGKEEATAILVEIQNFLTQSQAEGSPLNSPGPKLMSILATTPPSSKVVIPGSPTMSFFHSSHSDLREQKIKAEAQDAKLKTLEDRLTSVPIKADLVGQSNIGALRKEVDELKRQIKEIAPEVGCGSQAQIMVSASQSPKMRRPSIFIDDPHLSTRVQSMEAEIGVARDEFSMLNQRIVLLQEELDRVKRQQKKSSRCVLM